MQSAELSNPAQSLRMAPPTQPYATPVEKKTLRAVAAVAHAAPAEEEEVIHLPAENIQYLVIKTLFYHQDCWYDQYQAVHQVIEETQEETQG